MRQVHRAGEKTFVDYCGRTVPVISAKTGEIREAQIFVAVLGASNRTCAEATWTQSLPDWITSHQRAFAFVVGVTEIFVPDYVTGYIIGHDKNGIDSRVVESIHISVYAFRR